jgi:transcriptional regulator of aromatic amino acid metabolism
MNPHNESSQQIIPKANSNTNQEPQIKAPQQSYQQLYQQPQPTFTAQIPVILSNYNIPGNISQGSSIFFSYLSIISICNLTKTVTLPSMLRVRN